MNKILGIALVFVFAMNMSASSQTTNDASKITEVNMLTNIQKHVESLLAMKGDHFLNIEAREGKDVFQVTKLEMDGKKTLSVLIMYSFGETAEKTFTAAGINVPTGWKNISFEKGYSVAFDVTGSDASKIATFADAIYTRLLKVKPTAFRLDPDTNQ